MRGMIFMLIFGLGYQVLSFAQAGFPPYPPADTNLPLNPDPSPPQKQKEKIQEQKADRLLPPEDRKKASKPKIRNPASPPPTVMQTE